MISLGDLANNYLTIIGYLALFSFPLHDFHRAVIHSDDLNAYYLASCICLWFLCCEKCRKVDHSEIALQILWCPLWTCKNWCLSCLQTLPTEICAIIMLVKHSASQEKTRHVALSLFCLRTKCISCLSGYLSILALLTWYSRVCILFRESPFACCFSFAPPPPILLSTERRKTCVRLWWPNYWEQGSYKTSIWSPKLPCTSILWKIYDSKLEENQSSHGGIQLLGWISTLRNSHQL